MSHADSEPLARHIGTLARRHGPLLIALIVALAAAAVRLRVLDIPLERDEGEYAYMGQLILDGIPPYAEAYNMKMPGIYGIYALVMALFGESIRGIRLGLVIANLVTTLLLYLVGKHLYGRRAGCWTAASYSILSMSPAIQGLIANAEQFVLPFAVGGFALVFQALRNGRRSRFLLAGLLLGCGFIVKQHGALFVLGGAAACLSPQSYAAAASARSRIANGIALLAGSTIPFALACALMGTLGVFDRFWFWTFTYARAYTSQVPLVMGLSLLNNQISSMVNGAPLAWILACAGMAAMVFGTRRARSDSLALIFLFASFLSTCPGIIFRPHYFMLFTPALALLSGRALWEARALSLRFRNHLRAPAVALWAFFAVTLAVDLAGMSRVVLFMTPDQICRAHYNGNPFPETIELARYIRENSSPDARIGIIGSEPQICFYANRRSASGYLYTYPLVESHALASRMQREMIAQVEQAAPQFLVFVNIPFSWLVQPGSDPAIFTWYNNFHRQHYDLAGMVEIFPHAASQYRWGTELVGHFPKSPFWVAVFRRKADGPAVGR